MKYSFSIHKSSSLNQLAFYSLLGSSAFIILLWSPNVLGRYSYRYTNILVFILPWLMLWLAYSWQVIVNPEHRLEIILIVAIIILGMANMAFSDAPAASLSHLRTFLLTGIFAFWAAMFLLTDEPRRQRFDWLCAGALAVIAPVEIIAGLVRGNYGPGVFQIFTLHAIPLGTLIILLSPGPIRLIYSPNFRLRLIGWLLVLLGGLLIFFTHKRGTWLALAAMLAVGLVCLVRRHWALIVTVILLLALLLSLQAKHKLARLNPNIPHDVSILTRLELYNFAWHIWKTHPLMGMGLRAVTHEQYLSDYQVRNIELPNFPDEVKALQTLDNMLLTFLVELGSCLTLLYLGLVSFILARFGRQLWTAPAAPTLEWYRALVLVGFAIHSLSYDSLLFPAVNWVFHVQLGLMAGYQASDLAAG
jgi:O-antigen ligase